MARPQQARAAHTKAAILRAAAEVFDEYGYAGSGIQKIIERAGVTSGALYFHFKRGKQQLALEVMRAQPDTFSNIDLESDGLQRVVDLTLLWSYALQEDYFLRAGVRLTGEQATIGVRDPTPYTVWTEIIEQTLEAALAAGELSDDAEPTQIAEFLVGACTGIQEYSLAASNRKDLPERTVNMWRLLLPGIAAPGAAVNITFDTKRGQQLHLRRARKAKQE